MEQCLSKLHVIESFCPLNFHSNTEQGYRSLSKLMLLDLRVRTFLAANCLDDD